MKRWKAEEVKKALADIFETHYIEVRAHPHEGYNVQVDSPDYPRGVEYLTFGMLEQISKALDTKKINIEHAERWTAQCGNETCDGTMLCDLRLHVWW